MSTNSYFILHARPQENYNLTRLETIPDKIYGISMDLVLVKLSTILLYIYEVGLKTS